MRHLHWLNRAADLALTDAAAFVRNEPASNVPNPVAAFERRDAVSRSPAERPRADVQVVSPSAFAVLRLRILRGRGFLATDTADRARVAVLSDDAELFTRSLP